jgi:hypothetical protein
VHTNKTALGVTAGALAVAGGTHIAAYGEHLATSMAAAVFFAIVAVLQIGVAMVVLRGVGPRVRAAVVLGNLALIALWAWSRTTGLQIGPDAGPPEAVGILDLVAVAAQAVAVAAAFMVPHARRARTFLRPQVLLVGVALLVGAAGLRLPADAHEHSEPRVVVGHNHTEPHHHK